MTKKVIIDETVDNTYKTHLVTAFQNYDDHGHHALERTNSVVRGVWGVVLRTGLTNVETDADARLRFDVIEQATTKKSERQRQQFFLQRAPYIPVAVQKS